MNVSQVPFVVYNASAGSGKTYTLVKNYLKILLNTSNSFQFQQILAMTFTNKAAAEMKSRVLETLDKFQEGDFSDSMFLDIKEELQISDAVLQKRAATIYKNILNQYAGFNITTIDSFTYKLIKSFAFDLGLSMNFEVEMDSILLINQAIDVLLSKIGNDKILSETLIDFAKEKANDDKDWNIEKELQEIAKLLLKENDIRQLTKFKDKKIIDFKSLDALLYKRIKSSEKQLKEIANKAFSIIDTTNLVQQDFVRGGFYSFFTYLNRLDFTKINFEGTLDKNIQKDHHQCSGKAGKEAKEEMQGVKQELTDLYFEAKNWYFTNYPKYTLDKLIKKSLIPLSVLKSIQQILNEIKEDNNILFNAEFNQLISTHLTEQPAAFIYEKIGEKFRHYFIDEMQDTSILQWQNSIPLIKNTLESENEKGEKGSLLLVGDAKQSIYRWRGSKPEQFIDLTLAENPFFVEKNTETLDTNFRSHEEIISFNNKFFQYIGENLQNDAYKNLYIEGNKQKPNTKKGGYVEITLFEDVTNNEERDLIYPEKVLEIIKNLDGKFNRSEICILTRKNKQGVAIANYLANEGVEIVSSETLLLENAPKVVFIINLLKFIEQPEDKKAKFAVLEFLYKHLQVETDLHSFLMEFMPLETLDLFDKLKMFKVDFYFPNFVNLPFYESIENIIRSFNLAEKSDAYLQFFLDFVLEFSLKNNANITDFISYWEEKKDKLSIVVPEGKNAVTIMTIHKSKGLEFPVVIFAYDLDIYKTLNTEKVWYPNLDKEAYNGFTTSLVNYGKSNLEATGETGKFLVKEKTEALELDNSNMLYVALTRAEEQLYIISEYKTPSKTRKTKYPGKYGEFFYEFIQNNTDFKQVDNVYFYGNSKRVSSIKTPKTINKNQEEFNSSPWQEHQITIVPTTSVESVFDDARKYGTLLHEILAQITTKDDSEKAILHFVNKGIIPLKELPNIKNTINSIIAHPNLSEFYTDEYIIYNEREIVTEDKSILIPDRIAIKNNQATIIDYKTGAREAKYHTQINQYALVLEKMGHIIANKILVYVHLDAIELEFVD